MHSPNLILESILFHSVIWVYLHLITKYANMNIKLYAYCAIIISMKNAILNSSELLITMNCINLTLINYKRRCFQALKYLIQAEISYVWILTCLESRKFKISSSSSLLWKYFPSAHPVTKYHSLASVQLRSLLLSVRILQPSYTFLLLLISRTVILFWNTKPSFCWRKNSIIFMIFFVKFFKLFKI